jgi:hypothetical protein
MISLDSIMMLKNNQYSLLEFLFKVASKSFLETCFFVLNRTGGAVRNDSISKIFIQVPET